MKHLLTILVLIVPFLVTCGRGDKKDDLLTKQRMMETLIGERRFEEARLAAIDTLDPNIKQLYYHADDSLGHASHLDVNCNERIEELLAALLRTIPERETKARRDIYCELSRLYPKNNEYRSQFIFLDRKFRGVKQ
ncbi:MAG TPA: hypothetical protein VEI04_06490 [Syntrophobacteria bacterium]|nr:hypothetical protein [Syntrophobacteria bacterium]